MKFCSRLLLPLFLLFSGTVFAGVNLKVGSDIVLLAVNGKEVDSDSFFSSKRQVLLEDGINQILVQLNAEFKRSGDSEFESSDTHVMLFSAVDTDVLLSVPVIKKVSQLNSFNSGDQWILTNSESNSVNYYSAVLKKDGFQLSRNYEYELIDFNKTNSPAALKANVVVSSDINKVSDNKSIPMAEMMLRYWYMQADEDIRQRFKVWLSD